MPAPQMSAPNPAQILAQNLQLRQALLSSAPAMRKTLGSFSAALGQTIRAKLFNVGITTNLVLNVSVTYDVTGSPMTVSPKAPFNLINRIKVTDYDGTDRVNCSGYQLWVLQSVRNATAYGYNNESQTSVLTAPAIPNAVATGNTARFYIEVPLAYNKNNDLRGALLTQTAVGEAWLNIDLNTALLGASNADFPFTGGGSLTNITNVTIEVAQEYLLPQQVGNGVPLPQLDLMTVYEINGAIRSSDNLSSGQEKLMSYPNLRSVIGAYVNFRNNGAMNNNDVSQIRLIANGNNVLREYSLGMKLNDQRLALNSDLRNGTYFELSRQKPIETALFGNVQLGITPTGTVGSSNTDFEMCFESFYTKGSTLPGIAQSST